MTFLWPTFLRLGIFYHVPVVFNAKPSGCNELSDLTSDNVSEALLYPSPLYQVYAIRQGSPEL